jgi:RimM protein, required for 16S rRNA processing
MKVLKSWGAAGQVVLSLDADDPRDLKSEEPVFIEFDGLPVPFYFESVEPKGGRFIVKFEDVDSLEEAEELVGRTVTLSDEEEEEEDSLIGLQVRDARSRRIIGEIVDFNDYSGNVTITVDTENGEVLLPLHEDLIVGIHDDVITLDIPDGLL